MNKGFLSFFWILSVATLILAGIYGTLAFFEVVPRAVYDAEIFITQYVVTLLVFFLMQKAISFEPQYFVQITILSIVVKLIVYGAFNFIIIYLAPKAANANVVLFFSVYLIFTAMEIGMLYRNITFKQKRRADLHPTDVN